MPARIERDEVGRLLHLGAHLVEVLPAQDYEAEHIAGAINIPIKQLDSEALQKLVSDQPIVVYCHDSL